MNDNALITIDELLGFLGNPAAETESYIDIIINSVSQEFDRFTGRTLKQTTYTNLYLDGNGEQILYLPNWPSAAIATLTIDGETLTEGATGDYLLYTSDQSAYLKRLPDPFGSWESTWPEGSKNILIASVALGYSTIPGDIKLACLKQCAVEYQRMKQKSWDETSRSFGDGSVSRVDLGLLPDVAAVLKRYRLVRV